MKINSPYCNLIGEGRQGEKGLMLKLWILVVDNSFIQPTCWHSPVTVFVNILCKVRPVHCTCKTTELSLITQNSEADHVSFQQPQKPDWRHMEASSLFRYHRLQNSDVFLIFSTAAWILDELNSPVWKLTAAGKCSGFLGGSQLHVQNLKVT